MKHNDCNENIDTENSYETINCTVLLCRMILYSAIKLLDSTQNLLIGHSHEIINGISLEILNTTCISYFCWLCSNWTIYVRNFAYYTEYKVEFNENLKPTHIQKSYCATYKHILWKYQCQIKNNTELRYQ